MKAVIALLAVLVVIAGWFAVRQWYVDTHCATVLGTQVCGSSEPAAPAPSPTYVNVLQQGAYSTAPGAGPGGTTCSQPSTGVQYCH